MGGRSERVTLLPAQLLRVRTRKGSIFPLFGTEDRDLQLAKTLVKQFAESAERNEKRKLLEKRVDAIEGEYDDYKLVRGLSTLLERRCQFTSIVIDRDDDGGVGSTGSNVGDAAAAITTDPTSVRKALFEESARTGFALTDFERDRIIGAVASKMGLSSSYIRQVMWSDLEENMILERFNSIGHEELLGWYNLSLMQTLLFNCTRLEFSVKGGANWKRVLRDVKRFGLMYNLQQRAGSEGHDDDNDDDRNNVVQDNGSGGNHNSGDRETAETELVCSLDGPTSLFKLTDRYGTSIAKLLPAIVSSERWTVNAWVVRKTMSGKKIYEFKISSSDVPSPLADPHNHNHNNENSSDDKERHLSYFDSSVEEAFAKRFEQSSANNNGWRLVREPDPIVVSGGRAFIPDFMFEKYDRKVYLEIVGFWTKEYLEKKMQKLADVFSSKSIDIFVAVNQELACSKLISSSSPSPIPRGRVIFYKSESVPVKALLDYLKSIDQEQIERHASNPNLTIRFDSTKDIIIPIDDIALRHNIPVESAIRIALRDNECDYLKAGPCFILKSKANELATLLTGITRFADACAIFSEHSVPEPCHAELVSKLGYDVIWQSMDSSNAVIVRRE